ncbi:MAG: hypothetical protein DRG87_04320 [Deltaproteobacteria bacterium]|nr:MAG: hypothetical protein DRG87_04320 [Deltaproteobacteria bacterium]
MYLTLIKLLLTIHYMSRKTCNTFSKIIGLFILSIIFFLPLTARSSTKTLVLFPLAIYADQSKAYLGQGIRSMLISRISGAGIEIVPDEKYTSLLSEKEGKGITSQKRVEELARGIKADYAIFGSITTIGGGYSLDLSLLEVEKDGSKFTRISKAVDEDQLIPQLSDMAYQLRAIIEGKGVAPKEMPKPHVPAKASPARAIFLKLEQGKKQPAAVEKGLLFKPTRESQAFKPTGKLPLNMEVMAFDLGDLDGDGNAELVIVDRERMLVYQREGKSFVLIDTRKASWGEEFFKVSVGDIDNNGKAEIYVVSLYGMRARTSVYERFTDFKRLSREIGHIRVIKDPIAKNPFLLFQGSKVNEFFSGPIHYMNRDEKGKPRKGEELPEMRGAQFYTLLPYDLDEDGNRQWIGFGEPNLDDKSRLHVWDERGQLLWRGKRELGGTNNAIRTGEAAPEGLPPRISFNSRLVLADIDGDGRRDVVAIENIPMVGKLLNFKVYVKSRLLAYRVEGTSLSPAWTTGEIDYCVTDMQVEEQSLFLAAHKGKVSNIGKKSGLIMWFE